MASRSNALKKGKASSTESLAKHTPSAEMPDTSLKAQLTERTRNAALVLSNEINPRYLGLGAAFVSVVGLGIGFFFSRKSKH